MAKQFSGGVTECNANGQFALKRVDFRKPTRWLGLHIKHGKGQGQ